MKLNFRVLSLKVKTRTLIRSCSLSVTGNKWNGCHLQDSQLPPPFRFSIRAPQCLPCTFFVLHLWQGILSTSGFSACSYRNRAHRSCPPWRGSAVSFTLSTLRPRPQPFLCFYVSLAFVPPVLLLLLKYYFSFLHPFSVPIKFYSCSMLSSSFNYTTSTFISPYRSSSFLCITFRFAQYFVFY